MLVVLYLAQEAGGQFSSLIWATATHTLFSPVPHLVPSLAPTFKSGADHSHWVEKDPHSTPGPGPYQGHELATHVDRPHSLQDMDEE